MAKKDTKPTAAPTAAEPAKPQHPLAVCRPRGDRVVVRRDAPATTSQGGIIMPDTSVGRRQQLGTVVAVGPGRRTDAGVAVPIEDLAPGTRVVITGYAGLEVSDTPGGADSEYVMLRDEDVQAILPG